MLSGTGILPGVGRETEFAGNFRLRRITGRMPVPLLTGKYLG